MQFILFIFFTISVLCSISYAVSSKSTIPSVIYKGCSGCHGEDGKNKAFGKSEIIAGQDVDDLVDSIDFFKNSKLSSKSVTTVMGKQVRHLSHEQIRELASYISKLGGK